MKIKLFLIALLCNLGVYAQETSCSDGIDNDGNGLIDCFDVSCTDSCDNSFFYGVDTPICIFMPPVVDSFLLEEIFQTDDNVPMDARQNPLVADVDGDGIPEIIAKDDETFNELYVFDGIDGSLKYTIPSPRTDRFFNSPCVADADKDGFAEIYIVAQDVAVNGTGARKLFGFTFNNTTSSFDTMFVSSDTVGYASDADRAVPSISDFNEDGIPEIYIGNQIFNALTGALLGGGGSTNSMGENVNQEEYFPVAFDALPTASCIHCDGLELIAGNDVYSINFTNPTAWVLSVERSAAPASLSDGYTSVADFDKDGDVDAIVVSAGTVYVWDLQTSAQIGSTYTIPDMHPVSVGCTKTPSNTTRGGRANVSDFDGDGFAEIGVAGKNVYVVIDNDMSELWAIASCDGSQKTGSTVFDFEGDGIFEVVYRDELELYVLNGTDGAVKAKFSCVSATRLDYPLVADVNGDGQAEILSACGGPASGSGHISVFQSPNQAWVSSRKIWNQHGYHNTNINDDLTVPQHIQKHNIVGDSVILNNFLVQATYLRVEGKPAFAAPDDSIYINSFDVSECQNQDGMMNDTIITNVTIYNTNDASWLLPAGTNISLYNKDPFTDPTASYLATVQNQNTLDIGESEVIDIPFVDPEVAVDLYIVVNDNGTGSIPLSEPVTNIGECNYTNNSKSIFIDECLINVLPVLLRDFTAEAKEDKVLLEWITETEINNEYFVVEKSLDGKNFEPVLRKMGMGNSNKTVYYKDYDLNPYFEGNSYYRLKQVDFDGQYSYSGVRIVNFKKIVQEKEVLIYPNPNKGILKLKTNIKNPLIDIYSMDGTKVFSLKNEIQFDYYDIRSLENGFYKIVVRDKENQDFIKTLKLVLNK